MADREAVQRAVDANYADFKKLLPELARTHRGKHVLMRDGEAVEFFDSAADAMIYGRKAYRDGLFSIQLVTAAVVDLGYFSHAVRFASV